LQAFCDLKNGSNFRYNATPQWTKSHVTHRTTSIGISSQSRTIRKLFTIFGPQEYTGSSLGRYVASQTMKVFSIDLQWQTIESAASDCARTSLTSSIDSSTSFLVSGLLELFVHLLALTGFSEGLNFGWDLPF
jgi:hypothetical protein